jgi:hypothetical protein
VKNSFHLLICVICLFGCKSKTGTNQFFEFDEIDHYHQSISATDFTRLGHFYGNKDSSTKDQRTLFDLLVGLDRPSSLTDTSFLRKIQKYYPEKIKLKQSKFKDIGIIYTKKEHKNVAFASCEPIFRDILILRKIKKLLASQNFAFNVESIPLLAGNMTQWNWGNLAICKNCATCLVLK